MPTISVRGIMQISTQNVWGADRSVSDSNPHKFPHPHTNSY